MANYLIPLWANKSSITNAGNMNSSKFTISFQGTWFCVFLVFSTGCATYYMPVKADTSTPRAAGDIVTEYASKKLLILRQGTNSYGLKNPTVDTTALTLNANLVLLDSSLYQYINAKPRKYSYTNDVVLKEVHVFSKDSSSADITSAFTLPLNKIEKIEVIEKDKKRTNKGYIVGGIVSFVILYPIIVTIAFAASFSGL
jgi:hypothetical protein